VVSGLAFNHSRAAAVGIGSPASSEQILRIKMQQEESLRREQSPSRGDRRILKEPGQSPDLRQVFNTRFPSQ
jgi:hypothetical protein